MSFADWVGRRLVVQDVDGRLQPPGAGPGLRVREPDGSEMTVVARGDSFDLYLGKKVIYNHSITNRAAMSLAWWLVWWWVRYAWCGLKLRLWHWVQHSALERRWKEDA